MKLSRIVWRSVVPCALCLLPVLAYSDGLPGEVPSTACASPACAEDAKGIDWKPLLEQSLFFLGIEDGFRLATQDYTRHYLKGPFFADWGRSLGNLHGWGDGDNFLTNYVGHPMQGAVAGYVFTQNDRRYRAVEFGRNRDYWLSRARATLFSFAYSEAFEVGPLSEASIGNASAYYPQQGLVDHAITPSVGLLWMIGEDALDRYVVHGLEERTDHRIVKILIRGSLNPSRSMANMLALRVPWYRDSRSNHFSRAPLLAQPKADIQHEPIRVASIPTFELGTHYNYTSLATGKPGSLSCQGGGATATFVLNRFVSLAADLSGCKMQNPGQNVSGDSLAYLVGPHITWRNRTPWTPFVQFLVGGNKLSVETIDPERRPADADRVPEIDKPAVHRSYTTQDQTNAFAIKFGVGLDYTIRPAIALRLFEIDDMHDWAKLLNGRHYANNLTVTTGVLVRFGTW